MKKLVRVHTTPEEIAQYAKLKAISDYYAKMLDDANENLRAVYIANGRPIVGTASTSGLFAPKNEDVNKADAIFAKAMEDARNFRKKVGANRLKRMHTLILAGVYKEKTTKGRQSGLK